MECKIRNIFRKVKKNIKSVKQTKRHNERRLNFEKKTLKNLSLEFLPEVDFILFLKAHKTQKQNQVNNAAFVDEPN